MSKWRGSRVLKRSIGQRSSASGKTVWLVYAQVRTTMSQAWKPKERVRLYWEKRRHACVSEAHSNFKTFTFFQLSFSVSTRIRISSGMARAGWVSFSWMATCGAAGQICTRVALAPPSGRDYIYNQGFRHTPRSGVHTFVHCTHWAPLTCWRNLFIYFNCSTLLVLGVSQVPKKNNKKPR